MNRGLSRGVTKTQGCPGSFLNLLATNTGGKLEDFTTQRRDIKHAKICDDAMDDAGSSQRKGYWKVLKSTHVPRMIAYKLNIM